MQRRLGFEEEINKMYTKKFVNATPNPKTPNDIQFSFEPFLEKFENEAPEGLDAQYVNLIDLLESPFRNILKLPNVFRNLPVNGYFFMSKNSYRNLFILLPLIISMTHIGLLIWTGYIMKSLGVAIFLAILIISGLIYSPIYFRSTYEKFKSIQSNKLAPWIAEVFESQFVEMYSQKLSKNLFYISILITVLIDVEFLFIMFMLKIHIIYIIIASIIGLIGSIGVLIVIYINLSILIFVRTNSKLYNLMLNEISRRAGGYNKGHDSILSKNNYEVVKVLTDTPGLSIQSLGDIPLQGLLTSTFLSNSLVLLITAPISLFYIFNLGSSPTILLTKINIIRNIVLGALVFSLLLSFSQILKPIITISNNMGKFRKKALMELDPYIYEQITDVALGKKKELQTDLQFIFIIRQYIHGMKPSPINPFRLLYFSTLFTIYAWRGIPLILELIS